MASIERTAYPRFKRTVTAKELHARFTPTAEEIQLAHTCARGSVSVLGFLVMLKSFQYLHYFPRPNDIPPVVLEHMRVCLNLPENIEPTFGTNALYRHHQAIRTYLNVIPYGRSARHLAITTAYEAARVKDNPADLINVVLESWVNQGYEFPGFSTVDQMVRRIRTLVNQRFFETIRNRLSLIQIERFEALLEREPQSARSAFDKLKMLPKSSTRSHLQELIDHLAWITSLGEIEPALTEIPTAKIQHFAAEAKALDAQEVKKISPPKRTALMVCLLHQSRVQARDNLVEMFLKRMGSLHRRGREALASFQEQHREKTENLISVLDQVLQVLAEDLEDEKAGHLVKNVLKTQGGIQPLREDCEAVSSYNGNNYYPFLWNFYKSHRATLFRLINALTLKSTSQDRTLITALDFLRQNQHRKVEWFPDTIDLSFAPEQWRRTVYSKQGTERVISRRHFEVCIFSALANELKAGDICVQGSEQYADYREQLLSEEECLGRVADYCRQFDFPDTPQGFVNHLKSWLTQTAATVDRGYPENGQVIIPEKGEPILKRLPRIEPPASAKALEIAIQQRIPERKLLDILCNTEHWINWTRHFGPLSGSDPKLENPTERYIQTVFTYGCNLGPSQAARHMRNVTRHMLSFVNQRHVTADKIEAASRDIINAYHRLGLPRIWGEGKIAAADGTKIDLYEENLISEYHIRYGGFGGIAYHHIADNYIAIFSHFIPCGVWEAIYILEGLLKNLSEIQPDTIHSDTQGQSTPVFGMSYLLGINLMPRIRNWKDLTFYRPHKDTTNQHIDALFSDTINWDLIETHWLDLFRVMLSIQDGKISSAMLLRKLGNYSRKNRLYQAFRELGRVVRTVFLLKYISSLELRQQITESTNKVESYNGFQKWLLFGGEGIIADNDPEEQEKIIKYNDLIANAVIFRNVVDMTEIIQELEHSGDTITRDDVATLSPYLTGHIKRFGDYVVDLSKVPKPLDEKLEEPIHDETDIREEALIGST